MLTAEPVTARTVADFKPTKELTTMTRSLYLSIAAMGMLSGAVFAKANEGDKGAALPPVTEPAALPPVTEPVAPVAPVAAAPAKTERVKPQLTAVMTGLLPPSKGRSAAGVGGQPVYDFDKLVNVNDSFGIMNKTAGQIASTITGANKRHRLQAVNADGSPKFHEIKDAAGNVTGTSTTPVEVAGKVFRAYDVDPATYYPEGTPDADRAPCRVFLVENNTVGLPLPKAK